MGADAPNTGNEGAVEPDPAPNEAPNVGADPKVGPLAAAPKENLGASPDPGRLSLKPVGPAGAVGADVGAENAKPPDAAGVAAAVEAGTKENNGAFGAADMSIADDGGAPNVNFGASAVAAALGCSGAISKGVATVVTALDGAELGDSFRSFITSGYLSSIPFLKVVYCETAAAKSTKSSASTSFCRNLMYALFKASKSERQASASDSLGAVLEAGADPNVGAGLEPNTGATGGVGRADADCFGAPKVKVGAEAGAADSSAFGAEKPPKVTGGAGAERFVSVFGALDPKVNPPKAGFGVSDSVLAALAPNTGPLDNPLETGTAAPNTNVGLSAGAVEGGEKENAGGAALCESFPVSFAAPKLNDGAVPAVDPNLKTGAAGLSPDDESVELLAPVVAPKLNPKDGAADFGGSLDPEPPDPKEKPPNGAGAAADVLVAPPKEKPADGAAAGALNAFAKAFCTETVRSPTSCYGKDTHRGRRISAHRF